MVNTSFYVGDDKNRLITLFDEGKTAVQIGEAICRTPQAVYNKCKRLGLSFRERDLRNKVVGVECVDDDGKIPCLRCGVGFESDGAHNRICHACSLHNNGYLGVVLD